jgi:hypothetical protein
LGLQGELNDLARFFMESSTAPVEAYEDAARWEIEGPDRRRGPGSDLDDGIPF